MINCRSVLDFVLYGRPEYFSKYAIDTGSEKYTYRELHYFVKVAAIQLKSKGVDRSGVLAICFKDELLILITSLAASSIGVPFVVVRRSLLNSFYIELQQRLNVQVIIGDEIDQAPGNVRSIKFDLNSLLKSSELGVIDDLDRRPLNPVDPKNLFSYSVGSGSTGKAKIISVTHPQEISLLQARVTAYNMQHEDAVATLTHIEFTSARRHLLAALSAGCTVKLYPKHRRESLFELAHSDVSVLQSSVIGLHELLSLFGNNFSVFKNLRLLGSGGSVVSEALRKDVDARLTRNLHIVYGTNEMGFISVATPSDWRGRSNGIGKLIPGFEIQVVDSEHRPLAIGKPGLLRLKKEFMLSEYWGGSSIGAKFFRDGWFYPMDIVSVDKDGYIKFHGRADDLMIFNGINIYPSEIEVVIESLEGILDVAAFPLRHEIHQEIPVCAVVLKEGSQVQEKQIIEHCLKHLGPIAPKRIFLIEKIPRDAQGKLLRPQLRELIRSVF
jgi:acyl-coenzyme A synthetase/AMP-(fatty) acid ligase